MKHRTDKTIKKLFLTVFLIDLIFSLKMMSFCAGAYLPDCWYVITSDYEKGIAVRTEPNADSKKVCRIPKGTLFFVDEISGVWGHTSMPDYDGWVHLDYADNHYLDPSYMAGYTYTISSDYEPGIAIRKIPDPDGELYDRLPKGTSFYVDEVVGVWGKTNCEGIIGWINLDYAAMESVPYPSNTPVDTPETAPAAGNQENKPAAPAPAVTINNEAITAMIPCLEAYLNSSRMLINQNQAVNTQVSDDFWSMLDIFADFDVARETPGVYASAELIYIAYAMFSDFNGTLPSLNPEAGGSGQAYVDGNVRFSLATPEEQMLTLNRTEPFPGSSDQFIAVFMSYRMGNNGLEQSGTLKALLSSSPVPGSRFAYSIRALNWIPIK